jgi:glycosyltransferase involved in cell wall biosynthesis
LSADIFVLSTFSENFGVVVSEALPYGISVITTEGAPWSDLQKFRCGWWIDIGVPALVVALSESTSLTNEERIEMGKRGQNYVLRYDWLKISEQFCNLYQWLLNQESKPWSVKLQ